ncbi:MAG TPA: DUF533 domain-containing protein [Gemmatimonadales bacterium]|nr:DUF533 domain-containing protein [Gemmatimonadales bacterium]
MQPSDYPALVAIAMLASRADGHTEAAEQVAIDAMVAKIGSPDVSRLAQQVAAGGIRVADLAGKLSDDEARKLAYETAVAVCHADGGANPAELRFLRELQAALGITGPVVSRLSDTATALSGVTPLPGSPLDAGVGGNRSDEFILQQAILTGALEILPDKLANIAILPLQLRLVYTIGQRHGQQLDINQVKDLAATLGLGAAAQAMEGVVMKVLGGLAGGLLGGLVGGAARVASGAAVTFAATYALGHVAEQYYAQGRSISTADLKALFARFQAEAATIYPRVQQQVQTQAGTLDLQKVLAAVKGQPV